MITIKTGAWSAVLPDDHIKIGISRGTPRRFPAGYRMYRKLAPGVWFNSLSTSEFTARYQTEVLCLLDARQVYDEIMERAGDKIPVLCCFEQPNRPPTWCHRALTARWLADALGIAVPEFGFETLAQDAHPLRPPEMLIP